MLKLVVFTQEAHAKRAFKYSTSMLPYATFAFNAVCLLKRTSTSMRLQTLFSVANPCFAKVTNCTDHTESRGKYASMSYDTIACLEHALDLAALGTNRQPLKTLAKIAKCSGFLLSIWMEKKKVLGYSLFKPALVTCCKKIYQLLTFFALHYRIARVLHQRDFFVADLLLPKFLLFGLLSLAGFLFRHIGHR